MPGAEEQVVYQQLSFKLQELSPRGREWDLEIPESLFGDACKGLYQQCGENLNRHK
jgi:hypothetical protein